MQFSSLLYTRLLLAAYYVSRPKPSEPMVFFILDVQSRIVFRIKLLNADRKGKEKRKGGRRGNDVKKKNREETLSGLYI